MPRIDRRLALATVSALLLAAGAPSARALDHGWTIDPNGSATALGRSACTSRSAGLSSWTAGGFHVMESQDCALAE